MNRRDVLGKLAVTSGTLLAGCTLFGDSNSNSNTNPHSNQTVSKRTPRASTDGRDDSPVDSEPKTEINLVEHGADPTGDEPIDEILDEVTAAHTRVVLPNGRYRLSQHVVENVDGFELIGDDATIVPNETGARKLFTYKQVSNVRLEGITIDQRGPSLSGSLDIRPVGGTNVVRDVRLKGRRDFETGSFGLTVLCEGEDTKVTFERLDLSDGAINGAAVYVFSPQHFYDTTRKPGTISFVDTRIENWHREGLYASSHAGPIQILGGRYANNGIDQIRVGGGNDSIAIIRDVSVTVDAPPSHTARSHFGNMRGIWLEEGDGCLIENCEVTLGDLKSGGSDGAIVVGGQFGRATIENTTIRTDPRVPAINVVGPVSKYDPSSMIGIDRLPSSWKVTCSNVTIRGKSDGAAAIFLRDRDNCVFRDVDLGQTTGPRHGLLSVNASATIVEGGRWHSGGYPLLVGATEPVRARDAILCVRNPDSIQSERFSGGQLPETTVTAERVCIPPSDLEDRFDGFYIPYVGITGKIRDTLLGDLVRARWNGSNLVQE